MDRPEGNQFYHLILDGGVCQGRRIVSESALESLLRALNIDHRLIQQFLRNNFGITDAFGFDAVIPMLLEKSKRKAGGTSDLADRITAALSEHRLSGLRYVLLTPHHGDVKLREMEIGDSEQFLVV